jgi:hypothetical protein
MRGIVDLLLHSLSKKGLRPLHVKKLIKDVLYVLDGGEELTVEPINEKLERLGWDEELLDDYTFDLILCLLFDISKHDTGFYAGQFDGQLH